MTKQYGIIYCITNKINGKCYVGQTIKTLSHRWSMHLSETKAGSNYVIHRAIRKYGSSSFLVYHVDTSNDKSDLNDLERYYIAEYRSHVTLNGYNTTYGGEGATGYKPTQQVIDRQQATKKNNGYKMSDETKDKISISHLGDKNPMYGREVSLTTRKKLSEANSGKQRTELTRKKISDAKKGVKKKPLTKYLITFPDGHIEIIYGIKQFCVNHNLSISKMNLVNSGKRRHHKGYTCKRLEYNSKGFDFYGVPTGD